MSSSRTKQDIKIIICWLLRYLRTNSEIHDWRWIQDGFRAGGQHKFKKDECFETEISRKRTSMHYVDQNFACSTKTMENAVIMSGTVVEIRIGLPAR